jgi:hypothetical protein
MMILASEPPMKARLFRESVSVSRIGAIVCSFKWHALTRNQQ